MSYNQKWSVDSKGRSYCTVSGQRVYATSGSSASYDKTPTYTGRHPSEHPGSGPSSYPPRSTFSESHDRYTYGIPAGRYGENIREGSAPAFSAKNYDPYRDSMSRGDPPYGTAMGRQYEEYKASDKRAYAMSEEHKKMVKNGKIPQNIQNKDKSLASKNQVPRKYQGNPPQTREWHESSAKHAREVADMAKLAVKQRQGMASDYIGYDSQKNAAGHSTRVDKLVSLGDTYEKKYESHRYSHGRAEAEASSSGTRYTDTRELPYSSSSKRY